MLYNPQCNETTAFFGSYSTYEDHYNKVKQTVVANVQKYTLADIDGLEIDENNIPEHAWNQIAPNAESTHAQSRAQNQNSLLMCPKTLTTMPIYLHLQTVVVLHARFETAASKQEIQPSQYRELMRGLNAKQRQMVMFHRRWCKKAVLALKQGRPIEPYFVFLSGPGGVGKSHVIKLIHSDTLKLLDYLVQ